MKSAIHQRLAISILIVSASFICSDLKAQGANVEFDGKQTNDSLVQIDKGMVYGNVEGIELLLDLARPVSLSGRRPAIVYVHGGGWYMGNREQYHNEMRRAVAQGYIAATVTYRLTAADNSRPKNRFPAQIEDVKCAIRWLRANADQYAVDTDRIGIKGASAGGHLSLLAGTTDLTHRLEGNGGNREMSSRVQAVVNYYGPTDLVRLQETGTKASPMVEQLFGEKPAALKQLYELASPINHLSPDDPPILTMHGALDQLVPLAQATELHRRAKDVGARHELMVFEQQKHGFTGDDREKALDATFEFFDRHLKTPRSE